MTATATTTMATPIPIPAAAPEEIPDAGTGDDVGELSPVAEDVVAGWLVVVVPDCGISISTIVRQAREYTNR